MRGILTISLVASLLVIYTDSYKSASRADSGQGSVISTGARIKKIDPTASVNAAYQMHTFRIKCIATRLNELWAQEHEIQQEREQLGRAGDMASVRKLERDLLAARKEIDSLRVELTRENRVIALMDNQPSTKD